MGEPIQCGENCPHCSKAVSMFSFLTDDQTRWACPACSASGVVVSPASESRTAEVRLHVSLHSSAPRQVSGLHDAGFRL